MACRQSSPVITMVPMKKGLLLLFIIVAGLHQGSSSTYPADDNHGMVALNNMLFSSLFLLLTYRKLFSMGLEGTLSSEIGNLTNLEVV
ncbi:hypothetical protein BHE74_00058889 [Ensete ventricosum]|nr:hypothetical protein BHE74_00058889 [Ensete ventricosum]